MWTCPKCHTDCETPFCPMCGYQMPTQYSEADLLAAKVKKMKKRINLLLIPAFLPLIVCVGFFIGCWIHYHGDVFRAIAYWVESYPSQFWFYILILNLSIIIPLCIFTMKKNVTVWDDVVNLMKNNR